MIPYDFDVLARLELLEAAFYYESKRPGYGFQFEAEVAESIAKACEHPDAWPNFEYSCRKINLNTFPYGLVYYKTESCIIILSVMNLHRNPEYIKGRIPNSKD